MPDAVIKSICICICIRIRVFSFVFGCVFASVFVRVFAFVFVRVFASVSVHVFAFVFVLIAGGWWDLAGGSLAVGNRCLPVHQRPLLPSEMKSSGLARPSQTLAGKLFGKLSAGLKRDVSAEISRQRCCR